jgi:ribosomal protein S18 acetylase RimI-like enzyme
MANALNRHEGLDPRRYTPAIIRRDAFGRRRAFDVLVAEVGRRVVGYASFAVGYNTDIARRGLWMLDLFVHAGQRGHGVGLALMTAVAREAVRRGLPGLEWGVRGSHVRALRFYRGLGARISENRIASLSGRALAALVAG